MGIINTIILYGLAGLVVAAALALRERRQPRPPSRVASIGHALVHWLLWPMFAPLLWISANPQDDPATLLSHPRPLAVTDYGHRLGRAEERLVEALDTVGGVAEEVLEPERRRIHELVASLRDLANRRDEMSSLLSTPEFDSDSAQRLLKQLITPEGDGDSRAESVRNRLRNIDRLRNMRDRTSMELEQTLLKLEDVTAQILMLRFAERPQEAVFELIQQIAGSVEGVSRGVFGSYAA